MDKVSTLRQILLITDGSSNDGEDPIKVAMLAKEQGITVNVVGILEDEVREATGLSEVQHIAQAGGGVSQIAYTKELSQTVQTVTKKGMTQTIQGVVNQQLKEILGKEQSLETLPPEKRGEIIEYVDDLGERSKLEVVVLVDCSASMSEKLPMVKEALYDLSLSLDARMGQTLYSIICFPGKRSSSDVILEWTPNLQAIHAVFAKLNMGGMTPTGPALKEAIQQFKIAERLKESDYEQERYNF
jgi:Ca-activated chloride channel family protein